MDYMHEDPYASHRFPPNNDPYYSGGGGGHDANYANNTSFDRQSDQHSILSDRNRVGKNYMDIPNGGPYGSSNNIRQSHPDLTSQHPRSLSPQDYPPDVGGGGLQGGESFGLRESPYHNLPPYHRDPNFDQNYEQGFDQNYEEDEYVTHQPAPQYLDQNGHGGDPHRGQAGPPGDPPHFLYDADGGLHDGYYGHREGSYAGSRGSFQGPPSGDPHHSGTFTDPYPQDPPRYNGGVHYPEDSYDQQGQDYGYQGNPSYVGQEGGEGFVYPADQPSFHDDQPRSFYDEQQPSSFHEDPRYNPDIYDQGPPHSDSFRENHNTSQGPPDHYLDEHTHPKYNQQNGSFQELPQQNSYQGHAMPQDSHHLSDPYHEQDRYSDAPRSFEQPAGRDPYYTEHAPQQIDPSGHGDSYLDDSQRRYDGLPPVRADPFADDPFREANSRSASRLGPTEDPYYRGGSPAGGPDPSQFDERVPPYDDRGVPFDDRGPPYDERDASDPYSQSAPRYVTDYPPDFQEQEMAQRMQQLNVNAGRRTPSMDGRMGPQHSPGLPVRAPDLQEVVDFLSSPDDGVKASAAAHMQHVTYMDDGVKAKVRSLGGVGPLVRLLTHDKVEVHKNACGALQNLSYGKSNNDNKRAIKNEGGIPELIRLLRKSDLEDVKESVTGVLWNLSSCEDLKQSIIDDGLGILVNNVILKYSGYGGAGMVASSTQLPWISVCRNTTGVLRNVSSAGFDARKRLRESRGLVNALIYMLKLAAEDLNHNDIDNKVVENTVCILRNLSYRIQEVVDPDFYKKRSLPRQQSQQGKGKGGKGADGPGCFGNKSTKAKNAQNKSGSQANNPPPQLPPASTEYRSLWGPEIHSLYSTVLKRCTNPITMEAAAGAIQNLTACDWQPAVESRAMVRKEKGLPLLVDLLSAESDRVVCATATALRNLAIDEKNKELVGKYAIRQLVSRLPRDLRNNLPDDTICAVVATLYEVVKDNQDFALAVIQEDGLPRLMHINSSEGRYLARTLKFTQTLLKTLWGFKSLHTEYAKLHYGQSDFTSSKATPRVDGSRPPNTSQTTPASSTHNTPYNTLSRPMSAQGYDDSTLTPARMQHQRGYYGDQRGPSEPESFRMVDRSNASLHDPRDQLNYSRDRIHDDLAPGYAPLDEPRPHHNSKAPVGGVPLFPNLPPVDPPHSSEPQIGGEPVYAQVKKGRPRRQEYEQQHNNLDGGGGADSWV